MRELLGLQQNVSLADYTTFRIGGPAKYFFVAKTKKELIKAVQIAKKQGLPFFVLGGGSNLLVSDEGFNGLVIKCQMSNVKCQNQISNVKTIYAEAGAKLKDLTKLSAEEGLTGLEWAAGIPQATVGGAIKVNASAFDSSMKDIVKKVEVLDLPPHHNFVWCGGATQIILSALLELKKRDKKEIQKQIDYVLNYREKNHPMNFPSAGCIFQNPEKASAGELIERCGLKGKTIGRAQISKKHANFIVNLGRAKAENVLQLINLVKKKVKEKFNTELKEEIQYVGFS